MYARFRRAYYGIDCFDEMLLNVFSFVEKGPFVVIDCSRQNEFVKRGPTNLALPSWLLITIDCNERTGWSRTMRWNAWLLYLKIMLSCTSRDARNERGCGTCFWTMSENACTSKSWMQFTKAWNLLSNLDVTNTIRCEQYIKNCVSQNVLKIYNWWLQKNFLNKNTLKYLLCISFPFLCNICMNVVCRHFYKFHMQCKCNPDSLAMAKDASQR